MSERLKARSFREVYEGIRRVPLGSTVFKHAIDVWAQEIQLEMRVLAEEALPTKLQQHQTRMARLNPGKKDADCLI